MGLRAGTKLGPYEIVAPIGAGGMGEVYKARDTKLDRFVAIKVLPNELAKDEERVARFEREAKLLASLNHPNIASIYGFESGALVLELVEGPTLAERIAQGPIPVDECVAIAKQVVSALEAGHDAGIIHRDLKPTNVKLKEDGTVKVLDYGLAKALESESTAAAESDLSRSPTLTRQGTQVGVILGTAAYMSPEQAKGKRVDKRTDIWAFGAVVYEMLSGNRAFGGDDVSEVLASVIKTEPDFAALRNDTPDGLRFVLRSCLKKNLKERVRDIGDVGLAIDGAFTAAESQRKESVATRFPWIPVAAAFAVGAIVAVLAVKRDSDSVAPRVTRASITVPADRALAWSLAFSPDGAHLVYAASDQLYQRAMNDVVGTPIRNTGPSPLYPFFSPDGEWVGFFRNNELVKVPLHGGPAVSLGEANGTGAQWGTDGTIVFANWDDGILRISESGGSPELIVPLAEAGWRASYPQILPGGKWILSTLAPRGGFNFRIVVHPLGGGEHRVLVEDGRAARYLPTGHLVYVSGGTLLGAPFDVDTLQMTGPAVPLVDDVRISTIDAGAAYAVSDFGTLAYLTGLGETRTLVWVDRDGNEEAIAAEPRAYGYARVSPDGGRIAVGIRDQEEDIWIWEIERETLRRLTFGPAQDIGPVWTPDGQRLVFSSDRDGGALNVYARAADGTGGVDRLTESDALEVAAAFIPNGDQLLFHTRVGSEPGLKAMSPDGSLETVLASASEREIRSVGLSHDGRWLLFSSTTSGRREVYVRPFPNVDDGRWQISRDGGQKPLWAPDGSEVYYVSRQEEIVAVPVETEPTFTPGNPEVLFSGDYFFALPHRNYDITPDGERFLMIKQGEAFETLHLVLNWFEELKRLVPTD